MSSKILKSILGSVLSLAILVTSVTGLSTNVSAATAGDSHAVYADDFSDSATLSNWRHSAVGNSSYENLTAAISEGQLVLGNVNGSGSFLHGMRFIPDKKNIDQRVAITFDAELGMKPCLWARVSQTYKGNSQSCYGYYLLFNCNQNGGLTLDLAKRIGTASKTIGSITGPTVVSGQEYKLEMVCQGTNPTLISVSLYTTVGSVKNAIVCHNIFLDNEKTLQVASNAGIAGARTSSVTTTDVKIDSFEYTSTDKVTGNYYVEEGTTGSKTFGQVVMLDPTKKYIFAAHAVDNGIRSGEDVNPLWIECFNTSNAGERILIARSELKSNRLESDVADTGISFDEYFNVFYEFDMSSIENKKIETYKSGTEDAQMTRVLVGFRNDGSNVTAGKFTNFTLYAKDDANKTNLLINPDFKMGLYGWNDQAGSFMNYTQMEESQTTATNGFATLSYSVNDYEFYNIFQNSGYEVTQGDATRDTMIDIKDLVRTKKIASGTDRYYVAVDYDENGAVNASDLTFLRKQILGIAIDEGTQVNVSASDILSGKVSETDDSIGSGYTADYK